MDFVVDASMFLAWIAPDEGNDKTNSVFALWAAGAKLHAPRLVTYEVANGLAIIALKRKRITDTEFAKCRREFEGFSIQFNEECERAATRGTMDLVQNHDLTAYDASYLELALRLNLPLATLDKKLIGAARIEGVQII